MLVSALQIASVRSKPSNMLGRLISWRKLEMVARVAWPKPAIWIAGFRLSAVRPKRPAKARSPRINPMSKFTRCRFYSLSKAGHAIDCSGPATACLIVGSALDTWHECCRKTADLRTPAWPL